MVFKGAGRKSSPLLRAACRHSTQSGQVSAAASKAVMTAEDLSLAAKKHKHRMNVLLQHKLYKDKKHPVYNFLFTYVFINEKNLFRYTPGVDTVVSGISYRDFCDNNNYASLPERDLVCPVEASQTASWRLTPSPDYYTHKQLTAFTTTLHMLRKIQTRPPLLNCFGMHEWAMLYRKLPEVTGDSLSSFSSSSNDKNGGKIGNNIQAEKKLSRFQQLPLRVSLETIAALVETKTLRCTHFDAFRFFTPDAAPLNSVSPPPTRAAVALNDQPGCVHVTMDLFKWTMKIFPFCSSELVYDSLQLAIAAREVDMRASPYDLTHYRRRQQHKEANQLDSTVTTSLGIGMSTEPIRVELPEGQKEYQRHQERLFRRALDIRHRLIQSYSQLLNHYRKQES